MRSTWLFSLVCMGCSPSFTPADEAAIRSVMHEQERAWDRGDIPAFMLGYSDSVCFVSPRGTTCGKDQVTRNYLKSYPNKEAMGDLAFGIQEVLPAGDRHAWLTGTWRLERKADTLGGGFSLFWVKEEEGWRILRDHTY